MNDDTTLPGDFNADGDFNCADIDALTQNIAGQTGDLLYDLSGDGGLSLADVDLWLANAGAANLPSGNAYLYGDADLDGLVDGQDFIIWNANKFGPATGWCSGDFNADGVTDGQDFIVWNANKFTSALIVSARDMHPQSENGNQRLARTIVPESSKSLPADRGAISLLPRYVRRVDAAFATWRDRPGAESSTAPHSEFPIDACGPPQEAESAARLG